MTTKRVKPAMMAARMRQSVQQSMGGNPGLWHWGVVQSVDGGTPQTLTVTIDGDTDDPASGVRYLNSYVPTPTGFDTVLILEVTGQTRGEYIVFGSLAP